VDNLRDAVFVLRDAAFPKFDSLVTQLDYVAGRLTLLAENEAEEAASDIGGAEATPTNGHMAVRDRWKLLRTSYKVFIAIPGILASGAAVYSIVKVVF